MSDVSIFETTCPKRCPQFKKGERQNCVGCPSHGQCPLQQKALADMPADTNTNNSSQHPSDLDVAAVVDELKLAEAARQQREKLAADSIAKFTSQAT